MIKASDKKAYHMRKGRLQVNILVTGGVGFIGSHTCVQLLEAGYNIVIIDNLNNSKEEIFEYITQITGKMFRYYIGDIRDEQLLEQIFTDNKIDVVIHFAGLKAVGESVQKPILYYHNNIAGTLVLCKVMQKYNVKKMVFSSSATVYGESEIVPIKETFPTSTTNPYGSSKLMTENILKDICYGDKEWSVILLRYFNPIGAHRSCLIGENPKGTPNNLLPYVAKVAIGELKNVNVFGNDYETPDGTGIRDYIHVMDLANGHIKAIEYLLGQKGIEIFNLGTGKGYSVLDVIHTFQKVSGVEIPYCICPRRSGDVAISYSDITKAKEVLGWEAKYNLEEMCRDSWRFMSKNKCIR